ncbi:MAG: type II toxin-antitoxin system RelE/ParE family toxin [Candidatus Kapabacteria bacterium]|nr:type II toxin-antitoxin system RelE/ParE family toxin [Ignavibacteriota bacterium]MCW5885997.1 type II toxin-antitoxin system RelE/ParE family toxin [Candidatus Kapabacteria bacterium]
MFQVIWSNTALQDLRAIRKFIAMDSDHYSKLFAEKIVKSVKRLELFPESGRKSTEFSYLGFREILITPYKVIYHLDDNIVKILSIVHCKRDI